ncbi:MAG: DUF1015 domain-containing protein [Acutalibacteraceae bacterium]|nr:DUF1015 domain-containing protein [Acutalibacteraceae bacterium]
MKYNHSFSPADILLPKTDFENWSVIACDQYTSEPEYWQNVKTAAGDKPSALNIILPEVYLSADNSEKIEKINQNMQKYLENDIFTEYKDSLIYVERIQSDGKLRRGIVGKIDLECYDYRSGSDAEIRATEQTVLSRIPPRVEIRKNAPLEMPHVMLLFDDVKDRIFSYLAENKDGFKTVYDFTLMCNAGSIKGYLLNEEAKQTVLSMLGELKEQKDGFLFCVGDGNHSLATAKECYNQNKNELNRYALCEIVNIHDKALEFEPIYRVVFGADPEKLIDEFIKATGEGSQKFTCVYGDKTREISVKPTAKLAVGTLQTFLDEYAKNHPEVEIDYIHGTESLKKLASRENAVGFIFDGMQKSELFDAVNADGSLPRKTFSMGHADDKRFYIEARKIK